MQHFYGIFNYIHGQSVGNEINIFVMQIHKGIMVFF